MNIEDYSEKDFKKAVKEASKIIREKLGVEVDSYADVMKNILSTSMKENVGILGGFLVSLLVENKILIVNK